MKDYKKILEGVVNIISTTEKSDIGFVNICSYIGENCPELKESEDERIRKAISQCVEDMRGQFEKLYSVHHKEAIAWIEKQGKKPKQTSIWRHWKDGIAGNGEGEPIYLVKNGNTYSLNSCLGCECNYIELSELDKLMLEKQGKQETICDKCRKEQPSHSCQDITELGRCAVEHEQKPEFKVGDWSEDDDKLFNLAIDMIEWYGGVNENKPRIVSDWLKSLKDRVQPKQELNEENKEMFKSLKTLLNNASCYSCTEGVDKILAWLKQLEQKIK